MTDRRQDVHPDVLVSGVEEPERSPTGRSGRLAALALAAGLGFAAAQLVAPSAPDGTTGASLALVTGRQPHFESTAGDPPLTGMEVVLVNTGPTALRLDGAAVDGSELRWDVDRPLQPGQQAAAALREERPCEGPLDVLSGSRTTPRLRVGSHDALSGDRLPDVLLPLPPSVGRMYDDHVRTTCDLPRVEEALNPFSGLSSFEGADLVVGVGFGNRSVLPMQVVEVLTGVRGLAVRLIDPDGQPVDLPVTVPGSTRRDLVEGLPFDDPRNLPYRLRLTAAAGACESLRAGSGGDVVTVEYVDPQEPEVVAGRRLPLDLAPLVQRACAADGAATG